MRKDVRNEVQSKYNKQRTTSNGHYGVTMKRLLFLLLVLVIAAVVFTPHDQEVSHFIRSSPSFQDNEALAEWFGVFKVLGKGNILFLVALAVGSFGLKRRAKEMIIALLLSAVLVWPIKLTVQRERPNLSNRLSFPSADSAAVAASAVPLVAWTFKLFPAAGLVVLSVAGSRVFYGAHYPTDVCFGMALGLLAGILSIGLSRKWRWSPGWRGWVCTGCFFYLAHMLAGLLGAEGDLSGELIFGFLKIFGLLILFLFAARFIPVFYRKRICAIEGRKSLLLNEHE